MWTKHGEDNGRDRITGVARILVRSGLREFDILEVLGLFREGQTPLGLLQQRTKGGALTGQIPQPPLNLLSTYILPPSFVISPPLDMTVVGVCFVWCFDF